MLPLCYNRPSDFYPRSPCGERRSDIFPVLRFSLFLSTLSLRRATVSLQRWAAHLCDFYPRSPCGERRFHFNAGQHICVISIHALLAESDLNFHHRRPCCFQFLSTLSLRRATCGAVWGRCAPQISIHALLAESDCFCLCHLPAPGNFYPRSPCGERLSSWTFSTFTNRISIHALLAESDQVSAGAVAHGEGISIHALLAESDRPGPR